jgi:outer membrane murein-binding lipoprotein Lpp
MHDDIYRWWMAHWRRLVVAVLVAALALSGCKSSKKEDVKQTLDERLVAYEASLRAELNWLWDDMAYAQAHSSPTTDRCAAQDFKLQPVTMSADERTADDLGGKLVDQLDYAAGLLDAARAQWDNFCGNRASASDTIAFLNSRLTAANQTLDFVKDTLDLRAKSRASG